MKSFIEEYGFAILTAIVVIMLLCLTSPVGEAIGNSVKSLVNNFDEKTNSVLVVAGDATEKLANSLKGEATTETEEPGGVIDPETDPLFADVGFDLIKYQLKMTNVESDDIVVENFTSFKVNGKELMGLKNDEGGDVILNKKSRGYWGMGNPIDNNTNPSLSALLNINANNTVEWTYNGKTYLKTIGHKTVYYINDDYEVESPEPTAYVKETICDPYE